MPDAIVHHQDHPMPNHANRKRRTTSRAGRARARPGSIETLNALIEEATVDAYGDEQQIGGFHSCLEERLEVPFATVVLGIPVQVTGIDYDEAGLLVATCIRGKLVQRISLLELPLPEPPPPGHEWIAAYRHWSRGRG
jgi:hypothetical protein